MASLGPNNQLPLLKSPDGGDIYAQLEQKDRDLLLAAELGKALLEQNQELQAKQDQLQSQYTEKIEVLQQERYAMEMKLASVEGEHDSHLEELCSEIVHLQHGLARQHTSSKMSEQEKQQHIEELVSHNQTIAAQLRQTTEEKDELVAHIGSLENQVRAGIGTDQLEPALVEELEKKVQELEMRKSELMSVLTEEREIMHYNMDEATRRILTLERHIRELEHEVFVQGIQLDEVRRTHSTTLRDLEDIRLSEALVHICTSVSEQGMSLFEEFGGDVSTLTSVDNQLIERGGNNTQLQEKCEELQDVINTIQQHITQLTQKLRSWKSGQFDPNAPSTSGINERSVIPFTADIDITPAEIMMRIDELQEALEEIMCDRNIQHPPPSPLPGQDAQMKQLETHLTTLRSELSQTQLQVDLLQAELGRQVDLLKKRDDRIQFLTVKLEYRRSMPDPEALFKRYMDCEDDSSLSILKEITSQPSSSNMISDNVSDLSCDSLDSADCLHHEEEIKHLKKERDEAISKRETAEWELAEARETLDQLDGQMVGAVNQKLKLCKQMDNWEVDIHEMMDERLKKQLRKHEFDGKKGKRSRGKAARKRLGHIK